MASRALSYRHLAAPCVIGCKPSCGAGQGRLTALAVCALFALACLLAFPPQAHATFRDASDSYPAAQDLGSFGAPIYGDQLPDGAYKVVARTTSRMCILYTDPSNAEARDSKEQAIISVSGGNITVMFYISKAYTHLYMGTADSAAASTNEDGTDASAYIAGDPDEGYVPHLFALYVPALNVPMTISTYSGGDKGLENGKWYTREVVFAMTDAELQAIVSGAQDQESEGGSGQETGGEPSGTSESDAAAGSAAGSGSGLGSAGQQGGESSVWVKGSEEGITFTFKRAEADENTFSLFEAAFVDNQRLPESAFTAREGSLVLTILPSYLESLDLGGHVVKVTFTDGVSAEARFTIEEAAEEAALAAADTIGQRGVKLNGVSYEASALTAAAAEGQAAAVEKPFWTPQLMFALVIVLLFVGGLGWRAARFSRSFDAGERESQGC